MNIDLGVWDRINNSGTVIVVDQIPLGDMEGV